MSRRRYFVRHGERLVSVDVDAIEPGRFRASISGGATRELSVLHAGASTTLVVEGRVLELHSDTHGATLARPRTHVTVSTRAPAARDEGAASAGGSLLRAPMPGRVLKVLVTEGQTVTAGMGVLVVEAMKMENELLAPRAGTVKRVLVSAGASVERDAALVELA
jgi:biotin carboxyl carrier protein